MGVNHYSWLYDFALPAAESVCMNVEVGGTFTTDDIWAELGRMGAPEPNDPKSIAAAINMMRSAKIIESAGVTKCMRPERNSGYVTIWRVVAL